jgi:mitogen-activated protein kinase kinase kinase
MVRVTNYFDTQVRVPLSSDTTTQALDQDSYAPGVVHSSEAPTRKMTDQQMISWYGKILESVRLRYRKLQRFARYI